MLWTAVSYVASVVNTWFNFPLPGTNIGIGYLFFAAISIPIAFVVLKKFIGVAT